MGLIDAIPFINRNTDANNPNDVSQLFLWLFSSDGIGCDIIIWRLQLTTLLSKGCVEPHSRTTPVHAQQLQFVVFHAMLQWPVKKMTVLQNSHHDSFPRSIIHSQDRKNKSKGSLT